MHYRNNYKPNSIVISMRPKKDIEYIIWYTPETSQKCFELGVNLDYLPEEPKSPETQDTLDRRAYNLGLGVYRTELRISGMLRHVNVAMIRGMFVVYDQRELKKQLKEVSKSIQGLKQTKLQHPISENYLEKLIPRFEAEHQRLSDELCKK